MVFERKFLSVTRGPSGNGTIAPPEPGPVGHRALALRAAVDRCEAAPSGRTLDVALAAAAAAVAERRGERAQDPPGVDELNDLFEELPDYERLVELAVSETERSVQAAGARVWAWFGLAGDPPRWNDGERSAARLLVACACAPLNPRVGTWLGPRLLRLSADRWAGLLVAELRQTDEELWRRVLGEHYDSVWRRCAPRGKWRTRGLAHLLAFNDDVARSLQRQLSRWLAEGGDVERLPGELEAGFVHSRTPDRLA
jgi:hypothetical protein